MSKNVKGTLFVDYVRMIKSRKDVDWSKYLTPEDLEYLKQRVLPSTWYPFETYERLGMAIFHEITGGQMEMVRMWGRMSTDLLIRIYKNMIVEGEPAESARKFNIVRAGFFDFSGFRIESLSPKNLVLSIEFSTEKLAAEAQAYQTLGYLERLLELSGATDIEHKFTKQIWEGDPATVIELTWELDSA